MTIRFTVRNHGTQDKVIVVKQDGIEFLHEIEGGCESGFDVHAGNSFTVTEKSEPVKKPVKK